MIPNETGSPTSAVILLNWKGATDTMECVASLLAMSVRDFVIIICDNASPDGSFETLQAWGETTLGSGFAVWQCGEARPDYASVVLIQTGANLGFAGGCNVGLRFAYLYPSIRYFWLLNNDTVVAADSLEKQLACMEARPDVGILGSTLLFYDEPDVVQAPGGYGFNLWTARVLPLRSGTADALPTAREIEPNLAYISGASMLVRRRLLEEVGLMNEQYFLYFEEIDWATRATGKFALGYCPESRILHKEGRAIGSHREVSSRSSFSEQYLSRNRIRFLRSSFPLRVPICLAWIGCVGLVRILRGQGRQTVALWKGTLRGLFAPSVPIPQLDTWPGSMECDSKASF